MLPAGALGAEDIVRTGPPELQATSVRTDDSQLSGSSRSQSTRLSHVSPFALPEAQFDPRESLDGLQPALISTASPPDVHLQNRSPQHDQSLASAPGTAQDQHVSSGVAGAHAAQQAPLSSTANPGGSADQSGSAPHSGLQATGNPFTSGNSASAGAKGPQRPSAADNGQTLAPNQLTQITSIPRPTPQALAALSGVDGSGSRCVQHSDQQHSKLIGQQEVPGSPTVDDVLSGRSAATDRAALQELMELKAPVPVT